MVVRDEMEAVDWCERLDEKVVVRYLGMVVEDERSVWCKKRGEAAVRGDMRAIHWGERNDEKEMVGCVGMVVEDERSVGGRKCGAAAVRKVCEVMGDDEDEELSCKSMSGTKISDGTRMKIDFGVLLEICCEWIYKNSEKGRESYWAVRGSKTMRKVSVDQT